MADFSWKVNRGAGVFLHISSLPSEFGVGNIGGAADAFFDYLEASGFSYWQICPLLSLPFQSQRRCRNVALLVLLTQANTGNTV